MILSRILIVVVLSVFSASAYAGDWSSWKPHTKYDYLDFRTKYVRYNSYMKPGHRYIWEVGVRNRLNNKSVKVYVAVSSSKNKKNVKFPDDYSANTIGPGGSYVFALMDCDVPEGGTIWVHIKQKQDVIGSNRESGKKNNKYI